MTIEQLLYRSKNRNSFFNGYYVSSPDTLLLHVDRFEAGTGQLLDPNTLYVVCPEEISGMVILRSGSFLLTRMENPSELDDLDPAGFSGKNVLYTYAHFEEAITLMQNILFEELHMDQALRHIVLSMFEPDVSSLVDAGARELGCPLILAGSRNEIIYKSMGGLAPFEDERLTEIWEADSADALLLFSRKNQVQPDQRPEAQRICRHTCFYADGADQVFLLLPIRIYHVEIGNLFAISFKKNNLDPEAAVLSQLAQILGEKLWRQNSYRAVFEDREAVFFRMILSGNYHSREALETAMAQQKIIFRGRCALAVVHMEQNQFAGERSLNYLAGLILDRLKNIFWLIYDNDLLLLFNLCPEEAISRSAEIYLHELTEKTGCVIGISHYMDDLFALRQLYWQASQAWKIGKEYRGQSVTFFHQISFYAVLDILRQETDPAILADPVLAEMSRSRDKITKENLNTLRVYLECGCSASEAGKRLNMHRNTVLYRIEKLREKLDFDPNSGRDIMKYMMSFEVMDYLNFVSK